MVRLFIVLAAVALVLLILALIGSLSAERVRALPRALWVLVVVLVPLAGPIAYFLWGRPADGSARRPAPRPSSPDDDPDFLRSMDTEQSRRDRELLAQLEHELRRHDEPPAPPRPRPDDKPPAPPRLRPDDKPPVLRPADEVRPADDKPQARDDKPQARDEDRG
ncbi:hypothetical protein Acy02nite_59950 [Actinoplanes cyaneus]|uniref:Cardiolipin synthase N-terminal domain-containing protein n=1 Tax=Actinoplanes cyaneus TaxID=52696 RepID=A0A919ILJ0_9ACTN|nr:Phospholipase_D-nuclease N-terminal [Actinoplanes cyaneus]GID68114.1 hypothetical protein Acy02nite_59950 [Actinoplanes cyaneus]